MLTTITVIAAAIVFYVAQKKIRHGLKAKDLQENSAQVATVGVSADVKTEEITEVTTVKQARSTVAKSRARNKGKFQADDPATPENEAFKGGRKPRVRVKK